jgi:hypothetical protein
VKVNTAAVLKRKYFLFDYISKETRDWSQSVGRVLSRYAKNTTQNGHYVKIMVFIIV